MTNSFRTLMKHGWMAGCGLLLAGLLLSTGCSTMQKVFGSGEDKPTVFNDPPPGPVGQTTPTTPQPQPGTNDNTVVDVGTGGSIRFSVNELVIIQFSGITTPPPQHEERIKDDGKITLPYVGAILAAGKTPGELQKDIRNAYVDEYRVYTKDLTVTVKNDKSVYYVGGQVKNPNRYEYLGPTTVLKAVQAAGGFTDFAKKTKVKVTRASGKTITVDCKKAQKDSKLDIPIFPNDSIDVPRTWL